MLPTKLSSDTIQIVELPAQWYVGVRKSLSTEEPAAISKFIGPAYGQIMEQLGPQGIKPLGPPMTHTYNYTEDSIDIEAAFPVGEEANVNEPVICKQRPAGKAVGLLHIGSYEKLGETYNKLQEYLKDQDMLQENMLGIEIYITDPGENEDTSTWRTEVYYLLP